MKKRSYTKEEKENICQNFLDNPKINPETGGRLIYGKGPYLAYVKFCEQNATDNEIFPQSSITSLPDDAIFQIALKLNLESILELCKTNNRFKSICQDEQFWQDKAILDWNINPIIFRIGFETAREIYTILYKLHQEIDAGIITPEIIGTLYDYEDIKTVNKIPIEAYFPNVHVNKYTRSNISDKIVENWIGREHTSNTGIQFIDLDRERGIIKSKRIDLYNIFGPRIDLFSLQDWKIANVFVNPTKHGNFEIKIDKWNKEMHVSDLQRAAYKAAANKVVSENKKFWDHEAKFLNEQPWIQLNGLTPTEAVIKLRQLGW